MNSHAARVFVIAVTVALTVVSGCSKPKEEAPDVQPKATSSQALAEAKNIFKSRCTPCHGQTGSGDGPLSKSLKPTPRSFADPSWQKEVTDHHIDQVIRYGGTAVGMSPIMPGNPDLAGKDEVIRGLVSIVRSFSQP